MGSADRVFAPRSVRCYSAPPDRLIPVAQYVRMSTEHQRYSTENQAAAIAEYAKAHGMEIVQTYEDSGKSGLNLKGRSALQALLRDVKLPSPGFKMSSSEGTDGSLRSRSASANSRLLMVAKIKGP